MNAVEIEEAVSDLALEPFDAIQFPFRFLAAFGVKETTLKRLRGGDTNRSDITGGILQRNNIHLAVAPQGQVAATLDALRASPRTGAAKAKFIFATDGETLEAEDLVSGEPLACFYGELGNNFVFFLPLAGISTVKEIKNNPIDIKATGRLNKLYVELLKDNPDWGTESKRPALNRFMARLIFCFFAEDTGIFHGSYLFTPTIERMSDPQSGNTHEIVGQLFRAMGTRPQDRATAGFRPWADGFPYVNGDLFTGDGECPRFSRIARAYLLSAGKLDWREINPDIFGSMIQAVADDEERGALGMHYTSVPNILKVLNPLFLDDLREQLAAAGDNARRLRNLRKRLSTIRVFDPACGSGNFLVVAYLHMREIEHEIARRTGDEPRSTIRLTNFYGIEIKSFAAEIARLALLIAEFQADCRYLSQQEARMMVLPLHKTGKIEVGNALRLDWLEVCPPIKKTVLEEHDLGGPTGRLGLTDNGLGELLEPETYICGNPPYRGSNWQTADQKDDLTSVFENHTKNWRSLDYVAGWFMKASWYGASLRAASGFVSTNSICQGQQVQFLWPLIFAEQRRIHYAHTSFKWSNLASQKAGVTVVIVGLTSEPGPAMVFSEDGTGKRVQREVSTLNAYLVPGVDVIVAKAMLPLTQVFEMDFGNKADDGGHLTLSGSDVDKLSLSSSMRKRYIRRFYGSSEFISGESRYCIWIEDEGKEGALRIPAIAERVENVRLSRLGSPDAYANRLAGRPHQFKTPRRAAGWVIVTPRVSSEDRPYLPVGLLDDQSIVGDRNFAVYDAPLWNMALIASRLHWVWIGTVCVRMRTDFSYSNTLGWNTFPVPALTGQSRADLDRCAENILLAREAHFPATIADLYDPDAMPQDLRLAHDTNDDVLERIYIGRRFRNDTERLEKLFELYVKMTADKRPAAKTRRNA